MQAKKTSNEKIFTLQFFLLCLSSYLFFTSFNMIIPELPAYLASMGGEKYIGLIIGLFTLTAGISRPFSGKLTDLVGRIPIMIFGTVICFAVGFLYPVMTTISGFLFLRLLHGFSTGFKPTATSAYLADVVPYTRIGEAMGILGISGSLGIASGPVIGGAIANNFSLTLMFYSSSVIALLSILVLAGMKETLENPQRFKWSMLRIYRHDLLEPRVISPSLVMMLTAFSFGIVLTLIPDLSTSLGIKNKGLFFTTFTASSLFVRIIAGKVSDKYGRVAVLKVSTLVLALGMLGISLSSTVPAVMFFGVILGLGVGMNSPTVFAWTADLAHPMHRGRAMSTMFIALEIGIGFGALVAGFIYAGEISNIPYTFMSGAVLCVVAFLYLVFGHKPKLSYEAG